VITEVAAEEHVDLIAMATHGRSGIARQVLGSTATAVLRHAGIPVFLVRPPAVPAQVEPETASGSEADPDVKIHQ
jgi:hypothetical protein